MDVRAAAFSVPPQQLITCDGGIVEMGAEIQYGKYFLSLLLKYLRYARLIIFCSISQASLMLSPWSVKLLIIKIFCAV